jgi:hypothetical protein
MIFIRKGIFYIENCGIKIVVKLKFLVKMQFLQLKNAVQRESRNTYAVHFFNCCDRELHGKTYN